MEDRIYFHQWMFVIGKVATPSKCECAEAAAGTEDRQDNGQTGPHRAAWLLAAAGGGGTELNILH